MIWCPYTDAELEVETTSPEHIIPLSLGGSDGFTIPVDREFNAQVGSSIDGALAKDFSIAMRRRELDARGHSRLAPEVRVRKATFGPSQRPAQVTFRGAAGVDVWDAKERRDLTEEEKSGQTMTATFTLSIHDRLRFIAKVSLAAGYFIYGDMFRAKSDHGQVRAMMNFSGSTTRDSVRDLKGYHEYSEIHESDAHDVRVQRALCTMIPGSIVTSQPFPDRLVFHVGVLGKWFGMLSLPASTEDFLRDGDHNFGHVVAIENRIVQRLSYFDMGQSMVTALEEMEEGAAGAGASD